MIRLFLFIITSVNVLVAYADDSTRIKYISYKCWATNKMNLTAGDTPISWDFINGKYETSIKPNGANIPSGLVFDNGNLKFIPIKVTNIQLVLNPEMYSFTTKKFLKYSEPKGYVNTHIIVDHDFIFVRVKDYYHRERFKSNAPIVIKTGVNSDGAPPTIEYMNQQNDNVVCQVLLK